MKITVRHENIEIIIDRPDFIDYDPEKSKTGADWRQNIMNDTILPTLDAAVRKVKYLHEQAQG